MISAAHSPSEQTHQKAHKTQWFQIIVERSADILKHRFDTFGLFELENKRNGVKKDVVLGSHFASVDYFADKAAEAVIDAMVCESIAQKTAVFWIRGFLRREASQAYSKS